MFSTDYSFDLRWEYSTIKQHETGRYNSSTKEQSKVFFENYFSILNNLVIPNWWTQFNWLIVEESIINFLEITFILLL